MMIVLLHKVFKSLWNKLCSLGLEGSSTVETTGRLDIENVVMVAAGVLQRNRAAFIPYTSCLPVSPPDLL